LNKITAYLPKNINFAGLYEITNSICLFGIWANSLFEICESAEKY
jgi:hypothetical protein